MSTLSTVHIMGLEVPLACQSLKQFMIALQVGEVGELSEIFQWRGDAVANGLVGFSSEDKRHVGEEMSDVSPLLPYVWQVSYCGGYLLPSAYVSCALRC